MIKDKARKALLGLSIPQEYVCLSTEELDQRFSVFLTGKTGSFFADVTENHIFLGYKPVVIAIVSNKETQPWIQDQDEICLSFTNRDFRVNSLWRDFSAGANCVAKMILKKVNVSRLNDVTVFFFSGVWGEHSFLSLLHQRMNTIRRKFYQPEKSNVNLEGNLSDQVRIAYSVPRVIAVVTLLSNDGLMNMFPTDLHGPVDKVFYLSSLRIGGKANDQVGRSKKIVLSDIRSSWHKQAYALGKNHMRDVTSPDHFETKDHVSEKFSIPIPLPALCYRELTVTNSFDLGIHRIYTYEVASFNRISEGTRLTHIHQYAAQWRTDNSLQTDILLR